MGVEARRKLAAVAGVAVAGLVLGGLVPVAGARLAGVVGAARRGVAVAPSVQIPDTSYPIPAGALFVAPGGSDTNAGTQASPFKTVSHALAVAASGATVVLRAGTYRESFGTVSRPVTIQPYPHEQAWLSGADVVSGWQAATGGWVHHGWTAQFCHTCFANAAIDWDRYPLAGWPDQVFFNGVALKQVDDQSDLVPGTFYVNYTSHDLFVGSDPTGVAVEATSRVQAGQFAAGASGSVVRGIGVMRYGPSWNEGTPTGEIDDRGAANMRFENDVFTQSANRGVFVLGAANVAVVDSQFLSNGFTGVYVRGGTNFDLERNVIDNNNAERFWDGFSSAAGAGGVKISASYHVLVKGNTATNNWGNGIWNDVSSYDVSYVDNFASGNSRNGFYIEITGTFVVASNLSILNGQGGLKISGGTNGRIDNNTFADNLTYQISVHDDGRNQTDPNKIALGITWNTANNTFANNILAAPKTGSAGPLLFTEDNDDPVIVEATRMLSAMDYDLYTRPTATLPSLLAWWIHPAPTPTTQYANLADFHTGTGYESHGTEINGYNTSPVFTEPDHGNYTPLPGGPADGTGAPLPADIAALIGTQPGVTVDRGALVYPGSGTPPPTPPANDAFSQPIGVSGSSGSITGTTAGATVQSGEPQHGGVATTQSVWYTYQPSVSGVLTLDTCSNAHFDSVIAVYTGSTVSALTAVGANNDACGTSSQVTVKVTAGTKYRIAVADVSGGGGFTLRWMRTATGTSGPPVVRGTSGGDGWAAVAWDPPSFGGTSAISSYTVTAAPGGVTATVPAPGTRAILTGLTNGSGYTFTVTAKNTAGTSAPSFASASTKPQAGKVVVTTNYASSEIGRLQQTAAYFGETTAQAQHDSVGIIAYILGLIPPGATPVSPPPANVGPSPVTSDWPTADQFALITVARKYAFTPAETQKFSTQLVGYLLALGGH